MRLAAGLRPDPLGELKRPPRPPSRNKGCLLLREGRDGEREGRPGEGRGGERRGGEERGGEGRTTFRNVPAPLVNICCILTVWGLFPHSLHAVINMIFP